MSRLTGAARLLGYRDIEAAVARLVSGEARSITAFEAILKNWSRTTSLGSYASAYSEVDDAQAVDDEFLPLLQMTVEESADEPVPYPLKTRAGKEDVYQNSEAARHAAQAYIAKKRSEGASA